MLSCRLNMRRSGWLGLEDVGGKGEKSVAPRLCHTGRTSHSPTQSYAGLSLIKAANYVPLVELKRFQSNSCLYLLLIRYKWSLCKTRQLLLWLLIGHKTRAMIFLFIGSSLHWLIFLLINFILDWSIGWLIFHQIICLLLIFLCFIRLFIDPFFFNLSVHQYICSFIDSLFFDWLVHWLIYLFIDFFAR